MHATQTSAEAKSRIWRTGEHERCEMESEIVAFLQIISRAAHSPLSVQHHLPCLHLRHGLKA